MSMISDMESRSRAIAWPPGFDPQTADLFAHNTIEIATPRSEVWRHIVAASSWPDWFANAQSVTIHDGRSVLTEGTGFAWTTFGTLFESRVHKALVPEQLGWFGLDPSGQPSFAIEWRLEAIGNGSLVILEEVGIGDVASGFARNNENALHDSHELWLGCLRERAMHSSAR